jgi:hypothetical protein
VVRKLSTTRRAAGSGAVERTTIAYLAVYADFKRFETTGKFVIPK